jgi:hypothetical protein
MRKFFSAFFGVFFTISGLVFILSAFTRQTVMGSDVDGGIGVLFLSGGLTYLWKLSGFRGLNSK